MYANWIEWGALVSSESPRSPGKEKKKVENAADTVFAGVTFPRMKKFTLGLAEWKGYIPRIPSEAVVTLEIQEYEGPYRQEHVNFRIDAMDRWLTLISERFSNAKKAVVIGDSVVGIGRKEQFKKSMPNVEEFNLDRMVEMEEER